MSELSCVDSWDALSKHAACYIIVNVRLKTSIARQQYYFTCWTTSFSGARKIVAMSKVKQNLYSMTGGIVVWKKSTLTRDGYL